jgi:hypothetical protein
MNAVSTVQASKNLDELIEQIVAEAEPMILLNSKGEKAVLMSLDEFNSWQKKQESWLGCMKRTGRITGDIVSPVEDTDAWQQTEKHKELFPESVEKHRFSLPPDYRFNREEKNEVHAGIHKDAPLFKAAALSTKSFKFDRNEANER